MQDLGSRHSLRNFVGTIDLNDIKKAISIAQNAPSACNRQPSRAHIINDHSICEQILEVQTGNRGFGLLADKLIVLTSDLNVFLGPRERNDVYVNGGIYAMNLLYALHHCKIGACALNWCSTPEQDMQLRKIISIRPSETVILIIACGNVPANFKIARSPRNDISTVIKVH